jgi:carbamoyl-phosphate synthase large subunit
VSTPFTIVLSAAGRRVALLRLLRADAAALGLTPRIIALDRVPHLSAACALADLALAAPAATDPGFGDFVVETCRQHQVRLVIPTIDPELPAMAAIAPALRQVGTMVNISAPEAVAVARDKLATMRALAEAGIAVPRTGNASEAASWGVELIAKPRGGSASVGVRRVGPADLAGLADEMLVQERLVGEEYTVNLFVAGGRTVAAVPHWRRAVRAGEVEKGITRRHKGLAAIAARLPAAVPGFWGALCFQAIDTADGPKVFEINARFGGGFPLAHAAGAPFTRWLIAQAAGLNETPHDEWQEGTTMLRYDEAVFGRSEDPTWRA